MLLYLFGCFICSFAYISCYSYACAVILLNLQLETCSLNKPCSILHYTSGKVIQVHLLIITGNLSAFHLHVNIFSSCSCLLYSDWLWLAAGSESGRSSPYYGQDGRSSTPTTNQPPKHFHVPGRPPHLPNCSLHLPQLFCYLSADLINRSLLTRN